MTINITITNKCDNKPPKQPLIFGFNSGKSGKQYLYRFSSTDPEGGNIFYFINWGDETEEQYIGPYPSGFLVTAKHIWNGSGTYSIRVKAIDKFGAESDWTGLHVSISKTKEFINQFLRFLENYPILFQLLRQILRL
jgi:hypothetical protein